MTGRADGLEGASAEDVAQLVGHAEVTLFASTISNGTVSPVDPQEEPMNSTALLVVTVAAGALVVGGCSNTKGTTTSGTEPPAERGVAVGTGGAGANVRSDREFVDDAATKNMAEIELSRLAIDKSASVDVKTFAQMMLSDHREVERATGARVGQLVLSGQSIGWPAQLDEKQTEIAEDLAKKHGPDFDRDYLKAMVEAHQNFAAILESRLDVQSLAEWKTAAAGRAQTKTLPQPKLEMADVAVRPNKSDNEFTTKINQLAADTYPVAQQHLDTARALENTTRDVRPTERRSRQ